ncbi:MAG: OadG family protein [Bacteroidales bacterium]|nr:OadG family protein [Bacteroidales bacterium]
MKNIKYLFLTLVILMAACPVFGQSIVDLRLNEILINNKDNYTDEYGRHVPWVEVFNTSYNSVNIGGCYLTNDTTGLAAAQKDKKALGDFKNQCYPIPKGDPKTLMEQRSCLVFFLDGNTSYGPFHTSFTTEKTNYIALIGSDGKTLIDILVFPASLRNQSVSFGCAEDGKVTENGENDNSVIRKNKRDTEIKDVRKELEYITPASNNTTTASESKAEKLAKNDPYGIMMTIMSMAIVFSVLFVIFCVLKIFGYAARKRAAAAEAKKAAPAPAQAAPASGTPDEEEAAAIAMALDQMTGPENGEELAAISMALYLYLNSNHDYESEVLTFDHSADYATWGQKHFNFKKNPTRK